MEGKKLGFWRNVEKGTQESILANLNCAALKNKILNAALPKHWKRGSVNLEMPLVKYKRNSTSHT
jgi:hypothetical protein